MVYQVKTSTCCKSQQIAQQGPRSQFQRVWRAGGGVIQECPEKEPGRKQHIKLPLFLGGSLMFTFIFLRNSSIVNSIPSTDTSLFKEGEIYLKLASPWFSFIPDKHLFSSVLFNVWLLCGSTSGLLEYLQVFLFFEYLQVFLLINNLKEI